MVVATEVFRTVGRQTLVGYLHVSYGMFKENYGLLGNLVAHSLAPEQQARLPRYSDLHTVWSGLDLSKPKGRQAIKPFVRYKRCQMIPGLSSACNGHRVEVRCRVTQPWSNGLGAYITAAKGRCLDCEMAKP